MHFSVPLLLAGFAAASPALTSRNPAAYGLAAIEKRYTFPIPASKGSVTYSAAKSISGSFDGGMKTYGRGVSCTGQAEGDNSDAVFLLEDGATLSNAIIGEDQHEGVHCLGSCTLKNVWWSAVCEDALTFKGDGDATVTGGGAQGAEDKVIQHNGIGSVVVRSIDKHRFGMSTNTFGLRLMASLPTISESSTVAAAIARAMAKHAKSRSRTSR